MLQRNAGPQSQMGVSGQGRLENQMNGMLAAARALAGTAAPAESAVVGEQYLIFSLLEREFAIQAEYIQGVERLGEVTTVPNVASWVVGVINLRGSICSVVDLRAFLDMEQLPYNLRTRLLSVKYNEMVICLVVDSVSEMVPIAPNAIDSTTRSIPQWVASYASGIAAIGKRRVILLDAARLLFADKMHHYSA
ncbi:MAG TPA: chemotaxis protein CheW [Ktedonobacteraceae bacterium]|nr:chemotaxis protein CheW [Ktedonobacteraceae bacterium]